MKVFISLFGLMLVFSMLSITSGCNCSCGESDPVGDGTGATSSGATPTVASPPPETCTRATTIRPTLTRNVLTDGFEYIGTMTIVTCEEGAQFTAYFVDAEGEQISPRANTGNVPKGTTISRTVRQRTDANTIMRQFCVEVGSAKQCSS
ncbi:MAG: hypothetical protein ACMXYC_04665 [Candidatus Woesearchaeota archaeon]